MGIVVEKTLMGANIVRDFLAGISDIVGGRKNNQNDKRPKKENNLFPFGVFRILSHPYFFNQN
ncbi:heavy metal-binding domain-containing protein [Chengkuizengella axinellae]|uniref:Heavy metal-binding domain-containing protein n=1 Tax=Chengkuizengella axinellae TaxID=3064388 RepID=A0ABT9IX41_9BACL|nr:heavy metal-binding domain-containing protein [Chengkuizengella sp. 2205SS18-9]MDP5273941.1 heavy metal-binding domain-containing protein [Chengkuizengella sp. 2205SS18-9]